VDCVEGEHPVELEHIWMDGSIFQDGKPHFIFALSDLHKDEKLEYFHDEYKFEKSGDN
jgi:hypothetical protein